MLYQVYETQRTLMEPFIDFAQAAAKVFSNSNTPMGQHPMAQRVAAGYSLLYRLGKDYEKPSFDIHTVDVHGVKVAVQEHVALDKPFCELRRFKRLSDDVQTLTALKSQPTVLVVAPLSGHYATLLRDTVKSLLEDHKVYITDWKNARTVPLADGSFHLDDYVNYVQEFIRHIQGTYGNCHVISVCQPTVPVLAAVSLMASRGETTPLTMTMMGGPIDARKSPTAVNNLATKKSYSWFENNVIYRVPGNFPGAGRRVYPGFMQHAGFVAMNPDRHATSHYDFFKDLLKGDDASAEAHRKFYDEYNAVLDMDADYYLETIKTVFQEFKLVRGTWEVLNPEGELELVQPHHITTTAHLTVEGELDDISGSGQTEAAHALCTGIPKSMQKHMEVEGAGHYGIFSGRRWRDMVYPTVRDFIASYHPQKASATPHVQPSTEPVAVAQTSAVAPEAKADKVAKVVKVVNAVKKASATKATIATTAKKPAPAEAAAPQVKRTRSTASKPSASVGVSPAPVKKTAPRKTSRNKV